jgi:hypothetical protein
VARSTNQTDVPETPVDTTQVASTDEPTAAGAFTEPPGEVQDEVQDEPQDEPQDEGQDQDQPPNRKMRLTVLFLVGLVFAAAAIIVASSVGGQDSAVDLPIQVNDPGLVVGALTAAGFRCEGSVVHGDVATCSSTVSVRIFDDAAGAQKWVDRLLSDPLTNSSVGWVRRGNVVVAAPLVTTPQVAVALGPGAQKF